MMRLTLLAALLIGGLAACDKKDAGGQAGGKPDAAGSPAEGGAPPSAAGAASGTEGIPAKPPVDGELVIAATLKEISGPFPANDIYNYAYVMKYSVDRVVQGSYGDPDILVGHYNPRLAREEVKDDQDPKVGGNVKSFQVGDRHYLVLASMDKTWTGAVEDDYYQDKRDRYWAMWADKLP